jgi:hypothetical protein
MKKISQLLMFFLFVSFTLSAQWTGSGTATDPYQISTVQDLLALSKFVSQGKSTNGLYWSQTADIDMTGVNFTPIGGWSDSITNDKLKSFNGFYNGTNYKIQNLNIVRSTKKYLGLFGVISQAQVSNIFLEGGNISGSECVGGLVGESFYLTTITNCSFAGCIYGSPNGNVGGLVGWVHESTIQSSYTSGKILISGLNSDSRIGGMVGKNDDGIIVSSYSTMDISVSNSERFIANVGGLIGMSYRYNNRVTPIVKNSFFSGSLSASGKSIIGGLVGVSTAQISNCYFNGTINIKDTVSAVGGITGQFSNDLTTNYNIGSCYSAPKYFFVQKGNSKCGLFGGSLNCNVYSSYYKKYAGYSFGSNSISSYPIQVTDNELKTSKMVADVDNKQGVWMADSFNVNSGYPVLKWQKTPPKSYTSQYENPIPIIIDFSIRRVDSCSATMKSMYLYGNSNVDEIGLLWRKSKDSQWNKTIVNKKDTFVYCTLTGLEKATAYEYKFYAISGGKTYCGDTVRFSTRIWGGYGTSSNPYRIYTENDLKALSNFVSIDSVTYKSNWKLMTDLDLKNDTNFIPIGGKNYFNGIFNGNNKKITNLKINRPNSAYSGLFGYVSVADISSLTLDSCYIVGSGSIGCLVGYADNSTVSNCTSNGKIKAVGNDLSVGGLIGVFKSKFSPMMLCSARCDINVTGSGNSSVGGLIGMCGSDDYYEANSVYTSSSNANIVFNHSHFYSDNYPSDVFVGGFIGKILSSNIYNCYSNGSLEVHGDTVQKVVCGGFAGRNEGGYYIDFKYSIGCIKSSYSNLTSLEVDSLCQKGNFIGKITSESLIDNCYYKAIPNVLPSNGYPVGIGLSSKTVVDLKSPIMISYLSNWQNSVWTSDEVPFVNDGFPIFNWQKQTNSNGIKSVAIDQMIISPNPVRVNQSFYVKDFDVANLDDNYIVQIFDLTGHLVQQQTVHKSDNTLTYYLNNTPGAYIVKVTSKFGRMFCSKLLLID